MIILDNTSKTLEVVLGGSITTNQLEFVVSYVDMDSTTFSPQETDGLTNNTVPVTAMSSPGVGFTRQLKFLSIYNNDTVSAEVIVQLNNGTNTRIIGRWQIGVDYSIIYSTDGGFKVFDENGILKAGIQGLSGYSGISGISGYSGYSGYSGVSGFSGFSGFSGYSGVSGFSGYSGVSVSGFSVDLDSAESSVSRVFSGSDTTFTVTHGLSTLNIETEVYNISTGVQVDAIVTVIDSNNVSFAGNGNIADDVYRCVISGF